MSLNAACKRDYASRLSACVELKYFLFSCKNQGNTEGKEEEGEKESKERKRMKEKEENEKRKVEEGNGAGRGR